MQVSIDKSAIESCKKLIEENFRGGDFKEVGGYLLGTFNGEDLHVKSFHLDTHAESTAIRIKLSVDAFHEIEQIIKENPGWLYVGTWHVHPGSDKPHYSSVDVSTLFLERIIVDTDNPENLECPKIHLILNSDLTQHSCYTMDLKFNYLYKPLAHSVLESVVDSELLDIGMDMLKESKELLKQGKLENYYELQKKLDESYNNLDNLSDQLNFALDFLREIDWYEKIEPKVEKAIKDAMKEGQRIGLISSISEKKAENLKYRPNIIKQLFNDGSLIGFWVSFPYEKVDDIFLKIFLANFYKKVEPEPGEIFLFFLVQNLNEKIEIDPYFLNFTSFEGINYMELETTLMD